MATKAPTGGRQHKPATLAAVKTNTLAIEREVKEKFALASLDTSGCWWLISLTRTFSLATNWLRSKRKKEEKEEEPFCCFCTTLQIDHCPFTETLTYMTTNLPIVTTSGSICGSPNQRYTPNQWVHVKAAQPKSLSYIVFLTNPSITGMGL